jgi:hypothetical protein
MLCKIIISSSGSSSSSSSSSHITIKRVLQPMLSSRSLTFLTKIIFRLQIFNNTIYNDTSF